MTDRKPTVKLGFRSVYSLSEKTIGPGVFTRVRTIRPHTLGCTFTIFSPNFAGPHVGSVENGVRSSELMRRTNR